MVSHPVSSSPIDGTWCVIRAVHDGVEAPELVVENIEVELGSGKYCVRFGGTVSDRGHFKLSAEGVLELHGIEGPNKGKTIPAVYQHRGDRLRVCYGLDGLLPKDFTSAVGSSRYLVFYKRKHEA